MTNISNQHLQAYYESIRRNQVYRAYAANFVKKEEQDEYVNLIIIAEYDNDWGQIGAEVYLNDSETPVEFGKEIKIRKGSTVKLEAKCNVSWNYFIKWMDNDNTNPIRNVTMDSNKIIKAYYHADVI